jgi:hypothetical protein
MANGWTPERKAKQSALIRNWKPWEKSTGAKTKEGKKISSQNAITHGAFTGENREIQTLISSIVSRNKDFIRKVKI